MGTTSNTMVDLYGEPPHSTATHYLNHNRCNSVYRAGDRIVFAKVFNGRACILNSDGTIRRDYSLILLEEIGYILHPLKTLEELMEEYLEK